MKARWKFDYFLQKNRPHEEKEILDLWINAQAIAKERPRSHRTPIKTRTWTKGLGKIIAEQMQETGITIDFPVSCRYVVDYHEGRRPDIDNIEKALFDGLQRGDESGLGRAIENDNLIRGYVEKCEQVIKEEEDPFIWVRLYAIN